MALQLAQEQESGITGNYWKVAHIILRGETSCDILVQLYKDDTARLAGKTPILSLQYSWVDADNPCTLAAMATDNPYVLVYDKLKTLDEFTGATDV